MRRIVERLVSLVYPNVCEVCGRSLSPGEDVLCLHCLHALPRTDAHLSDFNMVHKRLASTVPIERAAGYFYYYKESPYVELIHRAKYQGRPAIVRKLAARFARELRPTGFFDGIDLILPVPMHRLKLIRRGYNQCDYIAHGLSEVSGVKIGDNLVATKKHATQTMRGSYLRWLNAGDVYGVKNGAELAGKHLLVVDDVLTTGSTMLACCGAIHAAAPSCRVSVLTLGVTHLS